MKSTGIKLTMFWVALVTIGLTTDWVRGQDPGQPHGDVQDIARSMGMDPALCDELQRRIDHVVSVSGSLLNDAEKVTQLTEILSQSLKDMQKASQNDPEADRIVKQYLAIIEGLLAAARGSTPSGDKQISPDVKNELQKLKILTDTYVGMMKIMCPGLKLPQTMNK
jgi:hypothetical protein